MIDILKDIEDLEKALKLLSPGSINNVANKKEVVRILKSMLDFKVSFFKEFEETFAPTDFGMSKINFNKEDNKKFDKVTFKKAI